MNSISKVYDRNGNPVNVGTKIKVLLNPKLLLKEFPENEAHSLDNMAGQVQEVLEIDEYGLVWVEMWFEGEHGSKFSHRLCLNSFEIESVD